MMPARMIPRNTAPMATTRGSRVMPRTAWSAPVRLLKDDGRYANAAIVHRTAEITALM